jgi:lipoyl(octanoyl) transferase
MYVNVIYVFLYYFNYRLFFFDLHEATGYFKRLCYDIMMSLKITFFPVAQPYTPTWHKMKNLVGEREPMADNELWLLEHEPVFTLGQAGKKEHILNARNIPIVESDRGGQVTYHGPGQLMAYCLFDMQQLSVNTRELVAGLEQAVINLLAQFQINACGDRDAPGVYVDSAKIASIGLRIRKGFTYHGLCLNVDGDLAPFSYINPCGVAGQKMTSLAELGVMISVAEAGEKLTAEIEKVFSFN